VLYGFINHNKGETQCKCIPAPTVTVVAKLLLPALCQVVTSLTLVGFVRDKGEHFILSQRTVVPIVDTLSIGIGIHGI